MKPEAETKLLFRFRRAFARRADHQVGDFIIKTGKEAIWSITPDANFFRAVAGKSRRFQVMMTEAPQAMAAPTTWRSSGSGRRTVEMKSSYPMTVAPAAPPSSGDESPVTARLVWPGRQSPDSESFLVDLVGPACLDQAVHGGLDDDVPEMEGVKDAGVEDGDRRLKRHSVV